MLASLLIPQALSLVFAATPVAGVDGPVHALATDAGGVYAAGSFARASGAPAANIARWDGSAWHPLGAGTDGPVYALFIDGGDVYAGGSFANAGGVAAVNVARWDGSAWSAVGGGVTGPAAVVKCFSRDAGGLLIGGVFAQVGASTTANGLARWTGFEWNLLGGNVPGIEHDIRAIAPLGGTIYVGGVLRFPGSTRPSEATLARATPFVLSDHAGSANANGECSGCASVDALAATASDLYAGGAFTTLGQVTVVGSPYGVVRLAGGVTPLGLGEGAMTPSVAQGGVVLALLAENGALFAAGTFVTMRGAPAAFIARWDGGAWSGLGAGVSGTVRCLVARDGWIYAGGDFVTAGGNEVNHIACWDGSAWSPLTTVATPVRRSSWGSLKNRFR
ncbi:MAG: hypothetical protein OEX18_00765 [Candidatus Krumholzibacteria bacterium]|nr:hypothetical protein [Candidatus Krumholzibacteria bacterium]MDH4335795.1 hypothetical protein [Candidatus Krumholzibacteria bacterium]MDH5269321.1 hypothetical protein [Candidatus Krumholzibacteria bacterium]